MVLYYLLLTFNSPPFIPFPSAHDTIYFYVSNMMNGKSLLRPFCILDGYSNITGKMCMPSSEPYNSLDMPPTR